MPGALETNPEEAPASVRESIADAAAHGAEPGGARGDGGDQVLAPAPRIDLAGASLASDSVGGGDTVKKRTSHNKITETLLRQALAKGMTLAECAHKSYMNRALSTLRRRAREWDLHFPDYDYKKRSGHKKKRRD